MALLEGTADGFDPVERLGRILLSLGSVREPELARGLEQQTGWGCRIGEVLLALGSIEEPALAQALSHQLKLPLLDRLALQADSDLTWPEQPDFYARALILPWARVGERVTYAAVDPLGAARELGVTYGSDDFGLVLTTKRELLETIERRFGGMFGKAAGEQLFLTQPHYSARTGLTPEQRAVVGGGSTALALSLMVAPLETLSDLGVAGAAIFALCLSLRFLVAAAAALRLPRFGQAPFCEARLLPIYTVLVPLYREGRALPGLLKSLRELDYPAAKLDIKLIVEADDDETLDAIPEASLPYHFEVLTVPPVGPRTKPKACNYALHYARGEFVVIFDAEDRPEPDQLIKAVLAFRSGPADLGCVQARLRYYNEENWLTRQFAIEYLVWFGLMLPGLQRLRVPLPLGGTSNHFPTALLRRLGAWDAYNVTEDADLGLRLAQEGYRTMVLDSVTDEEATRQLGAWLKQRTRWLKGYLQTYLVHMRQPGLFYQQVGPRAFFGFQLIIGGTFAAALLHPLWLVGLAHWAATGASPSPVHVFCLALLVIGNVSAVAAAVLMAVRERRWRLAGAALAVPAYWLLMSIAAWRALWHWFRRPHDWEKTEHGLTHVDWHAPAPIQAPAAAASLSLGLTDSRRGQPAWRRLRKGLNRGRAPSLERPG